MKHILTVTMNPSVDISYPLAHLEIDQVNRVSEVTKTAGGKGLNVTRVLQQLGSDVVASGIIGGTIGEFITNQLTQRKVASDFMQIDQESRNCIAILHDDGKQTEILEPGPTLTTTDEEDFLAFFENQLADSSLVTVSGSLPAGLSENTYPKMVAVAAKHGVKVILDCSGKNLEAAVHAKDKPMLIKPNQFEIGQLLGKEMKTVSDVQQALTAEPLFKEIEWIVVSLGAAGAIAKHGENLWRVSIPKIHVVNPVGSGDSTVAGLAHALNRNEADSEVLRTAMTAGMLNTMQKQTGFVDMSEYSEYFDQVTVKAL